MTVRHLVKCFAFDDSPEYAGDVEELTFTMTAKQRKFGSRCVVGASVLAALYCVPLVASLVRHRPLSIGPIVLVALALCTVGIAIWAARWRRIVSTTLDATGIHIAPRLRRRRGSCAWHQVKDIYLSRSLSIPRMRVLLKDGRRIWLPVPVLDGSDPEFFDKVEQIRRFWEQHRDTQIPTRRPPGRRRTRPARR